MNFFWDSRIQDHAQAAYTFHRGHKRLSSIEKKHTINRDSTCTHGEPIPLNRNSPSKRYPACSIFGVADTHFRRTRLVGSGRLATSGCVGQPAASDEATRLLETARPGPLSLVRAGAVSGADRDAGTWPHHGKIGRASCRERV